MIQQSIIQALEKILKELGIDSGVKPVLEIPSDLSHGDYTTNVAFQFSKSLKKSPMEVAEEIAKKASSDEHLASSIEKIEAVRPGFINFWIAKGELGRNIASLLGDEKKIYRSIKTKNQKFEIYENTGPNTNKPLHIGHLRNTATGVAIVNLRKAIGHRVWSGNINNDRGIHIIKAMWGYLQFGRNKIASVQEAKEFVLPNHFEYWRDLLQDWFSNNSAWFTPKQLDKKSDHLLGILYMLGDRAEKEKPESLVQMKEMLLAWENGETHVRLLWELMNNWFYGGFRQTHARFLAISPSDQQYDKEWYESEVYLAGKQIVMDNLDKGVFYKREDGAIMADLKKYNLPDKVVIRSDGTSLYITQDLELERLRIQEEKADLAAIVIGNEQELYFKQLFAIEEALGFGKKENFMQVNYGMVYLKGGQKMSSREGTVILADDLMDEVKAKIQRLFPEIESHIAEQVAIGAIKYTMLKYNTKATIDFDIDQSISIEGNSGPYIQYAYARTQSILRKGKGVRGKGEEKNIPTAETHPGLQATPPKEGMSLTHIPSIGGVRGSGGWVTALPEYLEPEELDLLRMIYHFPDIVRKAAENYAPNVVAEYLFELTKKFNLFYQKHRVLDVNDAAVKDFRLALTAAIGEVIRQGLYLLGIAAPQRM